MWERWQVAHIKQDFTCGNCGTVLLHYIDDEVIICPDCKFESEPCDFPDLNYL